MNAYFSFVISGAVAGLLMFSGCGDNAKKSKTEADDKARAEFHSKGRQRDAQRIDSLENLVRAEIREQKDPDIRLAMYTIQGYEYFAADYPADSLAPEYLFKAAQLYNGVLGNKKRAAEIYEKLYEKYPEYDKRGFVLFVTGSLHHELNDTTKAVQALEKFVAEYPRHQFAGDAQAMISYIRMDDKTRKDVFGSESAERQEGAKKPL